MAKPKYDYDSDYFYQHIRESADRQMQENHIIWDKVIATNLGFEIPTTFSEMKNGEYRMLSKEEDERRSRRINDLLSRARVGVEPEVWKMVLEIGLGKIQALDITFDKTGDKIQGELHTTVHKPPPNLNTLQMWLGHHSQICQSIKSRKLEDEENSDIPTDVNHGIDIGKWVEKEVSDD